MIVSLSLGLLLITGLTQSLPYPQEIHVQNIDEIINASTTNQSSSIITTTPQTPEITPIELNIDHNEHNHDEKIEMPSQDNRNNGRSLDSTTNFQTNTGLLTSIFLNPAVRPTEQASIQRDESITTMSDESSSTEMVKNPNESMMINNDSMPKVIPENINRMEDVHMMVNQTTEMGKDIMDGQNDQPIMDDQPIMPEHINENIGDNHNTEIVVNRKYTEINRDNQYLPNNNDHDHHNHDHHNHDHHNHEQYSTVANVHANVHTNIHENQQQQNNHRETENDSDEDMKNQSHADIKQSPEIHYDHTEVIMESSSVMTNMHDMKPSDDNNKMDMNKSKLQEPKASNGNKLETIYKFGTITILLYITTFLYL